MRHSPSGMLFPVCHCVALLSKMAQWIRVDKAFSFRFSLSGSPFCRPTVKGGSVDEAFAYKQEILDCSSSLTRDGLFVCGFVFVCLISLLSIRS